MFEQPVFGLFDRPTTFCRDSCSTSYPRAPGIPHPTAHTERPKKMESQERILQRENLRRRVVAVAVVLCALVVSAGLSGCELYNRITGTGGTTSSTAGFATTVVIGDSLSAGFQNGSLLDSQQPNGWASLVAKQANFSLALPLIASPGVPAVLELTSLGPPPVIQQASGISVGR